MIILALSLAACSDEKATASFEAMDTAMNLTVYGYDGACERIKGKINELDRALDATDENSEIYKLNLDGSAELGDDAAALLSEAITLCGQLEGFDITVYPAVTAWGFTTGEYRIPDEKELKELAGKIDHKNVALSGKTATLSSGAQIDLGAVAKGYAADVSLDMLSDSKAAGAVLNLGGTIALYGKKPDGSRFRIGVADPEEPAGYFGYLERDSGVIATSGGYERFFEKDGKRYIHILDPSTAYPADNGILSVTAVCGSGARADALSTALFVIGLDKAEEYYRAHKDFDFIILTDKSELYITDGVYDGFTLSDGYDLTLHKVQ